MFDLSEIIAHGSLLCESQAPSAAQDIVAVLVSRLHRYQAAAGQEEKDYHASSLETMQIETAQEALSVLDLTQQTMTREAAAHNAQTNLGVRDMGVLRTLLSIVFKWGVEPPYTRLADSWPGRPIEGRSSRIMDLTNCPQDFTLLRDMLLRLLALVYPAGVTGSMDSSGVILTLISPHLNELLKPCLALGWLPKSISSSSMPVVDEIRPMIMRLITSLPAAQVIPALAAVMDSTPHHVRKTCSSLLSRQILRPDGLGGLYQSMFDSQGEDTDEAPLEKYEQISRLLSSVPAHTTPEAYFAIIIPRLLDDLVNVNQSKSTRASAFVLSRMLSASGNFRYLDLVSDMVTTRLHRPFNDDDGGLRENVSDARSVTSVDNTILTLTSFVANCDPSPALISGILSPVAPALYAISRVLQEYGTADPTLRESVHGLLMTWGRIVDAGEGVTIMWKIIQDYDQAWHLDVAGQLSRSPQDEPQTKLSMFTPNSLLQADEAGDFDIDANLMDLRPDPTAFAAYIKSINRPDIASEIFVRLLEAYQLSKSLADDDPLQSLLYLQIIVQLQVQIPPGSERSDILKKPEQLLSFVKGALETAASKAPASAAAQSPSTPFNLQDLRIIGEPPEDETNDSDDEDEDTSDEDITSTAINLLLSLLEIHPQVSVRNAPVLNDIFDLLEPLAIGLSPSIQPLAREARLVITARLASTSSAQGTLAKNAESEESAQEIYQKALQLLQDPILPVRAHGLLLLRQLVTTEPKRDGLTARAEATRPLVPAILSIFRQCLQDQDSYIFLNAVQGLSAMVETYGKDVLTGLVIDYCDGLDGLGGLAMTQTQVDVRVRIGEALGQVILRCGSALGLYAGALIPHLFAVVRTSHFPTPLRVSAISLLAQCTNTYALSIVPYIDEIASAMVDLLQLEQSSSANARQRMDDDPTSTNAKVPPMRRSALHLLSLLTRACLNLSLAEAFDPSLARRIRITLAYVAATDVDPICKLQAKEGLEGLAALETVH